MLFISFLGVADGSIIRWHSAEYFHIMATFQYFSWVGQKISPSYNRCHDPINAGLHYLSPPKVIFPHPCVFIMVHLKPVLICMHSFCSCSSLSLSFLFLFSVPNYLCIPSFILIYVTKVTRLPLSALYSKFGNIY